MHPVRTLGLLAAMSLAPAAASAAPRARPTPRPALQIRAVTRTAGEPWTSAANVLRKVPPVMEPPGAYARITRWVEEVALPRRDGRPKLVVVAVPGGLGLAWARRW